VVSLTAHSFNWGMSAVWLLIEPLVGPVAVYNLTLLLAFVLSGYAMCLPAREFTGHTGAAFIAGLLGGLYEVYSLLPERGRWRWRTVALLALGRDLTTSGVSHPGLFMPYRLVAD